MFGTKFGGIEMFCTMLVDRRSSTEKGLARSIENNDLSVAVSTNVQPVCGQESSVRFVHSDTLPSGPTILYDPLIKKI